MIHLSWLLISCTFLAFVSANIPVTIPVSEVYSFRGTNIPGSGAAAATIIQWGIRDTFQYDFHNQTVDVDLQLEFYDSESTPAIGVRNLIGWAERGLTLAIGYPYSSVSLASAQAGTTYGVAQLSSSATSASLSNDMLYPYFSRISSSSVEYATSIVSSVLRAIRSQGRGYSRIAIITSSDEYGQSAARAIIDQAKDTAVDVVIWESYLPDATNVTVEVREVVNSDARVVIVFTTGTYSNVLLEAERQGIVDDYHVFIGGAYITGGSHVFPNGTINEPMVEAMRGHIGVAVKEGSEGERYERLLKSWNTAENTPGSPWGSGPPGSFWELYYDLGVLTTMTVMEARRQGVLDYNKYPTAEQWTRIARNITFEGATGLVQMDSNGDRPMVMSLLNWIPELLEWRAVGEYDPNHGTTFYGNPPIIWHDNTTNFPDLQRQPGYYYWSCDAGKKKFDETGHVVIIHTPDSGGFDDIDIDYVCDHFIDCPNLSDESGDCGANYTALFIGFGILTGLLILFTCCLLPFVVLFGFVLPRRRVKASSPTFLIIIILSCILGYISEFAWYGRPHPVSCGFRPWLLGLAVVSLVSALNAKTWRLWRIFKTKQRNERITDLQLLVLYVVMVIPAIVILVVWTIVSTPTAGMVENGDDSREHYICTSGGFTGDIGTLIFFIILVVYEAFILLIAAILCIVTRNVPSFFNESKLLAISVYNLVLLAAVGIPVIVILEFINPFAAWVLRSVAVLYAFTATLVLQFAPKVVGVIVIDKGRNSALPSLGKTAAVGSSSSSEHSQPSSAS